MPSERRERAAKLIKTVYAVLRSGAVKNISVNTDAGTRKTDVCIANDETRVKIRIEE